MPDISTLMEQASKKKFKKSTYRPWNYLEEIEKEQAEKAQEESVSIKSEPILEHKSDTLPVAITEEKPQPLETIVPHKTTSIEVMSTALKEPVSLLDVPLMQPVMSQHIIKDKEDITHPLYVILRLSGHQKTIFHFILERCLSRGLLSSGMITSEMLTTLTHTSLSMVNTSIQRLVEKGLLCRENGKRGRGGFYCFGLQSEVKEAALQYKKMLTPESSDAIKISESIVSKEEGTKLELRKMTGVILPPEWDAIDIEPLTHIGFSQNHLVQLYKQQGLESEAIQDSIYHFAFDMKHNNKSASITKSSPLGYFMGILKRSGLYTAPDNYVSPRDQALKEMLARKKQEKEKRDAMMKELITIAFDEWQSTLTTVEKDNLLPDDIRKGRLMAAKTASLKTYFIENVWPKLAPKELS